MKSPEKILCLPTTPNRSQAAAAATTPKLAVSNCISYSIFNTNNKRDSMLSVTSNDNSRRSIPAGQVYVPGGGNNNNNTTNNGIEIYQGSLSPNQLLEKSSSSSSSSNLSKRMNVNNF